MTKTADILLVDDDEDDVFLTREGFRRAKFAANITHVENGIECMKYLRRQDQYTKVARPDIVLLDLNMPLMDGREVLEQIVKDPDLKTLPVVILTTSDSDKDILEMYDMRCNSYIVKPVDFHKFQQAIMDFTNYWFTLVSFPPPHREKL